MIEQYAVAALYLVPVAVAALVAYFVTREPAEQPRVRQYEPPPARRPTSLSSPAFQPRDARYELYESDALPRVTGAASSAAAVPTHGTLLHAALSAHFDAVARAGRRAGSRAQPRPAAGHLTLRSVSVRRPTRSTRRAAHRCYRESAG